MPVIEIHDLDDPRLAPFQELKTRKSEASHLFVAEGRFVVERLLQSSLTTDSVLLARRRWAEMRGQIPDHVPVLLVEDGEIHRIVGFRFHSGVMAAGVRPRSSDPDLLGAMTEPAVATLLIAPQTRNPDNLGSLVRSAAALGVDGLILGPGSADPFSRRAVRVSAGAMFTIPILEAPHLGSVLAELRDRAFRVVGTVVGPGAIALRDLRRPAERVAVMVGSEDEGLEEVSRLACDVLTTIPMARELDSLNVAVAAAIVLFALRRSS